MVAIEMKTIDTGKCNGISCGDCDAYQEDFEILCCNTEKMYKYAKEQHRKETIKWLTESLKDPNEVKFWQDEFGILIISEAVQIVNILEEKSYGGGTNIIFEAKINEGDPIKIHCNSWYYPGNRYEPDDYGLEFNPL